MDRQEKEKISAFAETTMKTPMKTPADLCRFVDKKVTELGVDIHAFEDNIDDDNYSTVLPLLREEENVTGTTSTKASAWDDNGGMSYPLLGQEDEYEAVNDEKAIQAPESLFSILAKSITRFKQHLFNPPNTSNRFTKVTLEELWKWNELTQISIGDITKRRYFWFIYLTKIDYFSLDREMASRMSFFKKMMDPDISFLETFPRFPKLPFASWSSVSLHRLPLEKRIVDKAEQKCKRELRYLYDARCSHRKLFWLLQYDPGVTEFEKLRCWMFEIIVLRKILLHASKCVIDAMLGGEEGLIEYQKRGYYLDYKVDADWKDSADLDNYMIALKKGLIKKRSS